MKIELVDVMGDDLRVVNSARVSFKKEHDEFMGKDEGLINYLAKHNHFTPFTHPQITLREKVPIFVARQRFKHVVGFTYNEVSRRYVDDDPEFYVPSEWRSRPDGSIKQGSGEPLSPAEREYYHEYYYRVVKMAEECYAQMIADGVAPEQARMVLPQSMYTTYYVTGSLAAFARAYTQRIDSHAQVEIQYLAEKWNEIIAPLFPYSWKALTEK